MSPNLLGALVAFGASALAAPFVFRALLRMNSRQTVSQHVPEHAAKQGTPTMGGFIILVGVAAALLAVDPVAHGPALALLAGFGLLGFVDDYVVPRTMAGRRGLGWKQKIAVQTLVTVGALWWVGFQDLGTLALGTLAVLFFSNAYNFADGMDALAGGLLVLLAGGLVLIAGVTGETGVVPLLFAMMAATLPFLVLNAPPARVFMGDVGALPVGALLGWCVLQLGWPGGQFGGWSVLVPLAVVSLVMVLELVPVPLQICWVKLTGRRMFSFHTPIHHGFQHAGWPESRVVGLFYLVQGACSVGAFLLCLALQGGGRP